MGQRPLGSDANLHHVRRDRSQRGYVSLDGADHLRNGSLYDGVSRDSALASMDNAGFGAPSAVDIARYEAHAATAAVSGAAVMR